MPDPYGPDDALTLEEAVAATVWGSSVTGSPTFVRVGDNGPDLSGGLDSIGSCRPFRRTV
jgi:hypothetical protein